MVPIVRLHYIVGQALKQTPGVFNAKVSMRAQSAVVTYDPSKTNVDVLIAATTEYGYPSQLYPGTAVVR